MLDFQSLLEHQKRRAQGLMADARHARLIDEAQQYAAAARSTDPQRPRGTQGRADLRMARLPALVRRRLSLS
jgi:hypothetical protein